MLLHFSLRKQVGGVLANLCRAFFHTLERNLYIKHNVSVCWGCWPQYAPGSDPEIPEKCCEHRLPSRRCWLWVSVQVQCGAHQNLKLRRDETFSAIRVKDLTRKIVNKAHHVYMDNSPPPPSTFQLTCTRRKFTATGPSVEIEIGNQDQVLQTKEPFRP